AVRNSPGSAALFFFSSRRRHTRSKRDWSSDVCSSDLALVPATGDGQLPTGAEQERQLLGHRLGEWLTSGSRHEHSTCAVGPGQYLIEGLAPHIGTHDHAGPAPEGSVVHGAVPVLGPSAQVVHVDGQQPLLAGLAHQAQRQRREVVGEDGDDIDTAVHSCSSPGLGVASAGADPSGRVSAGLTSSLSSTSPASSPASRPGGGSSTTRRGTSTSGTICCTKGMRVRRPLSSRSTSASCAGKCWMSSMTPNTVPWRSCAGSPRNCRGYQASGSPVSSAAHSSRPRSPSAA